MSERDCWKYIGFMNQRVCYKHSNTASTLNKAGNSAIQLPEIFFWERNLGFWERNLGCQERNLGFWERNLGFRSVILVFLERNLGFQERNLGLWERNLGFQ